MLGICCLLFIITGIQFWITDYMLAILKVEESKVYITFAIVCITAPTFGVLLGGYFIEQLGGYTDKRALEACYKISILAACCGLPLPLIDNYYFFVLFMWLLLFFGGSIVPGLTGIMLSAIPQNNKEMANSITHFCHNLIGYFPAPILYGVICTVTGGANSKFGLVFLMLISLIGVYFFYKAKLAQEEDFLNPDYSEKLSPRNNHMDTDFTFNRKHSMMDKTVALSTLYGRLSLPRNESVLLTDYS